MIEIRKADERGHADHGWLNAYHTFSFADYFDRDHMGFRSLRVINEDRVSPGEGFGTHGHRDMEIITYVLSGALEHKDSMGNGSIIRPGDAQYMSAGTGVQHSEFNASKHEQVHLLQIWILPDRNGYKPRYDQKRFEENQKLGKLCLIAAPDDAQAEDARDALKIRQDAYLYSTRLEAGHEVEWKLAPRRYGWIQVARGSIRIQSKQSEAYALKAGDGAAIAEEESLKLSGTGAEILCFDLA